MMTQTLAASLAALPQYDCTDEQQAAFVAVGNGTATTEQHQIADAFWTAYIESENENA